MAHPEQQNFFRQLTILYPEHFNTNCNVLEIGSQDINGSVRDFFKQKPNYLGLDLGMAKGVDWTIPGELIELPDQWAKVCISTECFEHAESWKKILMNMIRTTSEDGLLILSVAGDGRQTHGTVDSETNSSPFTTSYYKNLGPDQIGEKIRLGHYFKCHGFQVNSEARDTYFWGIRSGNAVNTADDGWQSPLDRLARAQGQLAQAVNRHNEMKELLGRTEDALEICRQELATEKIVANQTRILSEELKASNESLQQQLDGLKNSRSWKLTAVLRSLKDGYDHLR